MKLELVLLGPKYFGRITAQIRHCSARLNISRGLSPAWLVNSTPGVCVCGLPPGSQSHNDRLVPVRDDYVETTRRRPQVSLLKQVDRPYEELFSNIAGDNDDEDDNDDYDE